MWWDAFKRASVQDFAEFYPAKYMKIRVKKISPLQAGKMLAVTYALLSVVIVPFILLAALVGPKGSGSVSVGMAIAMPVTYILGGFIGGIIGSFLYNLVAGWLGGIEIEFEEEKA